MVLNHTLHSVRLSRHQDIVCQEWVSSAERLLIYPSAEKILETICLNFKNTRKTVRTSHHMTITVSNLFRAENWRFGWSPNPHHIKRYFFWRSSEAPRFGEDSITRPKLQIARRLNWEKLIRAKWFSLRLTTAGNLTNKLYTWDLLKIAENSEAKIARRSFASKNLEFWDTHF